VPDPGAEGKRVGAGRMERGSGRASMGLWDSRAARVRPRLVFRPKRGRTNAFGTLRAKRGARGAVDGVAPVPAPKW
jgi:hypothetical protein